MRAYLKKDITRVGTVQQVYVTPEGQKRLELILDDEEIGGLSVIDADIQEFEIE